MLDKKQLNKKYREGNKDEIAKKAKKYYHEHKEERDQYGKKHYHKHKKKKKQYQKKYNQEHREEKAKYDKKYIEEHIEERKQYSRKYHQEHREEIAKYYKKYNQEHKEEINRYQRIRNKTDLCFRLNRRMSSAIQKSLKNGNGKQGRHWESLISYNMIELKKHLKNTLPENYTWKDFLQGRLHIDHIHPLAIFQYDKPEDLGFQVCWGLNNLRLLPSGENLKKHTKLIKPFQKTFAMEVEIKNAK